MRQILGENVSRYLVTLDTQMTQAKQMIQQHSADAARICSAKMANAQSAAMYKVVKSHPVCIKAKSLLWKVVSAYQSARNAVMRPDPNTEAEIAASAHVTKDLWLGNQIPRIWGIFI
jgi:hypothetical protein